MIKNIRKTTIREFGKFEFMFSVSSAEIIFKIDLSNTGIETISKQIVEVMKEDYMNRSGVYFLRLDDGFYIGKATNLKNRFKQHLENKSISSITFATYKNEFDLMEDEQIRDLESLLIQYAQEYGLQFDGALKNRKNESRKKRNYLDAHDNGLIAREIWGKFAQLNIDDILEEKFSHSNEFATEKNEIISTNTVIKKVTSKNSLNIEDKKWLKEITSRANMEIRRDELKNESIFLNVPYRGIPTSGYSKGNIEIFNKEYSKKCILMYLHGGLGNGEIDRRLTNKLRKNGYVTAVTLAYFNIETSGRARGTLSEMPKTEATNQISELVEKYHQA